MGGVEGEFMDGGEEEVVGDAEGAGLGIGAAEGTGAERTCLLGWGREIQGTALADGEGGCRERGDDIVVIGGGRRGVHGEGQARRWVKFFLWRWLFTNELSFFRPTENP